MPGQRITYRFPRPNSTFSTPAGKISFASSASFKAVSGVISEGLMTTQFPAASAGASSTPPSSAGSSGAMEQPQPDRGGSSRYGRPDTHPPPVPGSGPRQQRTETHRPPRDPSPSAQCSGLPQFRDSSLANSSACASITSASFRHSARVLGVVCPHCANARSAACTAASTCAADASAISSRTSPVGYRPAVFPLALTSSPLISSRFAYIVR